MPSASKRRARGKSTPEGVALRRNLTDFIPITDDGLYLTAAQCQGEDIAYFHQSRDALMLQVKMQCGKIADERKLKNDLNKMLSAMNKLRDDGGLTEVPDVQAAYKAREPTKRTMKLMRASHDIHLAALQAAHGQPGPSSVAPQALELEEEKVVAVKVEKKLQPAHPRSLPAAEDVAIRFGTESMEKYRKGGKPVSAAITRAAKGKGKPAAATCKGKENKSKGKNKMDPQVRMFLKAYIDDQAATGNAKRKADVVDEGEDASSE